MSAGYLVGGWPVEISGVGRHHVGSPFARCAACPPGVHIAAAGTFSRYGQVPLCRTCASALAAGADIPFVQEALARVRAFESEEIRGNRGNAGGSGAAAERPHKPTSAADPLGPEGATPAEVIPK
jgi:hypothetical protein